MVTFMAMSILTLNRTLITSTAQLQQAKDLLAAYKHGQLKHMTPDLWRAKKVVDATLHPGIETLMTEVSIVMLYLF